jgi:hypothetical protein
MCERLSYLRRVLHLWTVCMGPVFLVIIIHHISHAPRGQKWSISTKQIWQCIDYYLHLHIYIRARYYQMKGRVPTRDHSALHERRSLLFRQGSATNSSTGEFRK